MLSNCVFVSGFPGPNSVFFFFFCLLLTFALSLSVKLFLELPWNQQTNAAVAFTVIYPQAVVFPSQSIASYQSQPTNSNGSWMEGRAEEEEEEKRKARVALAPECDEGFLEKCV